MGTSQVHRRAITPGRVFLLGQPKRSIPIVDENCPAFRSRPSMVRGWGTRRAIFAAVVTMLVPALAVNPLRAERSEVIARRAPYRQTWIVMEGETTVSSSIESSVPTATSTPGVDPLRRTSSFVIAPGSELTVERDGDEVRLISGELFHGATDRLRAESVSRDSDELTLSVDPARGSEIMLAQRSKGRAGDEVEFVVLRAAIDETESVLRIWLGASKASGGADGLAYGKSISIAGATIRARMQLDEVMSDEPAAEEIVGPTEVAGEGTVAGACPPDLNFTPGSIGPDITVFSLQGVDSYASAFPASAPNGIAAFAVGTTSCNTGDTPAAWYDGGECSTEARRNRHPVIGSGMFRLSGGRFEQIGLSWVKHGFFAVNQNACGSCQIPDFPTEQVGYFLGVNCSDPYSAQLNGNQASLGPRSQINAFSGAFPYPPMLPLAQGTKIERRLQVLHDDLNPNIHPDALFFVEGQYVALDDAFNGNGQNNSAYRKVNMIRPDPNTTNVLCPFHKPPPLPQNNVVHYCAIPAQPTVPQQPAIRAWQDNDPSVVETDFFTPEDPATTDSGLVILSAKASARPGGLWHYEYAMENITSDRAIGSFRVTIPPGAIIENVGFHDVPYHSGNIAIENQDGADWEVTITDQTITWSTLPFAVKQNANAIRWGTLYNFRFDINAAPQPTSAVVGLFKPKPPLPDHLSVLSVGPAAGIIDCNNNGIADPCDVICGEGCGPNCGQSEDCDFNSIPDDCEADCNENQIADLCDLIFGPSEDCNGNEVPDECEPDCDQDGIPNVCETVTDSDTDGVLDCDDLCPSTTTTPPGACVCPDLDRCCFAGGTFCIPNYPRDDCLDLDGVPDCLLSPCRDGCLIGDADLDGDRDFADFAVFMTCFSGNSETPAFIQPSQSCRIRFDYNDLGNVPGDVDLGDYNRWGEEFLMGGPRVGP